MKHIMKNPIETPKQEKSLESKEISNVFPNGKFTQHSSNPYKYWGESTKKSYFDKFSNSKPTIKDNQSLKVILISL